MVLIIVGSSKVCFKLVEGLAFWLLSFRISLLDKVNIFISQSNAQLDIHVQVATAVKIKLEYAWTNCDFNSLVCARSPSCLLYHYIVLLDTVILFKGSINKCLL